MSIRVLQVVLLASLGSWAWTQTITSNHTIWAPHTLTMPASPPLVCAKYQHVEHWDGPCGPVPCDEKSGVCLTICTPPPPDKCVDDMHSVTEREWQELMRRLGELEKKQK